MKAATVTMLAVLVVVPAAGQDKLSDVAAEIKLQDPADGAVLVNLGPAPVTDNQRPIDAEALVELSEELAERTYAAADILDELGLDDTFHTRSWQGRMLDACTTLESAVKSLAAFRPEPRYTEPYELVMEGADECQQAIEVIRNAISLDQPLYGPAVLHLAAAERPIAEAIERTRSIRRAEMAESPPPTDDVLSAQQAIAALCASRTGGNEPVYGECVANQQAAFDAITARHNFHANLDQPRFNTIRNHCRAEWPADYVSRDRCERLRIEAAGGE
jgi:hypothetical protein